MNFFDAQDKARRSSRRLVVIYLLATASIVAGDVLMSTTPRSISLAMDAAAEAQVFELFREESRNKMTILISHRFSTVRAADQIVVLHDGRIIEAGSHESLLAEKGTYAHLFQLQAKGYQ